MADDNRQVIIEVDPAVANGIIAILQQLVIATNKMGTNILTALPVTQSTATSATAGTNGDVPAQVLEYLVVTDPHGNSVKIPAYNL